MNASTVDDLDYTVTRRIAAPRPEVFRAWTDPALLSQWWGPHAIVNPECEIDPRPGGRLRILMRDSEGRDYPLGGEVVEFVEPDRLALSLDVSAYPPEWHEALMPGRPGPSARLLVIASFASVGEATELHVRVRFETATLREACLRAGLAAGWEEGLDSLAALLRPSLTSPQSTSP